MAKPLVIIGSSNVLTRVVKVSSIARTALYGIPAEAGPKAGKGICEEFLLGELTPELTVCPRKVCPMSVFPPDSARALRELRMKDFEKVPAF
ncbi:MAG: hypothetical protein ACXVZV_00095 [Terriglobales bacterium]